VRAVDGANFQNISATTAAFQLDGGRYGVDTVATFGGGSVTLQKLGADGSTWITALTAFSAAGFNAADLPAGSYRVAIATASGVYVCIRRIPTD
jgi:hypothetical protein